MLVLSFIWVTLLVLASLATTVALPSGYIPVVAVAWGLGFIAAKTTTVPYDPRHQNSRPVKLSYREYHSWALDAAQAMRHPSFHRVAERRFLINPVILTLTLLSAAMHAGMFGWATLLSVLQGATLASLVSFADVPWPWSPPMSEVPLTVVGAALAGAFGLLGGTLVGIYYRWARAWPF